jgi:dTMP kinase
VIQFISVEGPDGAGKTTQIQCLSQELKKFGYQVYITREPGGCVIAEKIRKIVLDSESSEMQPVTELLCYAAARAQHVEEVIKPRISNGEIVICDRFSDSTVAYQGYGRGLSHEVIESLNIIATGGLAPDRTLLFMVELEIGKKRLQTRNTKTKTTETRFDDEAAEFCSRVADGFSKLAKASPERIRMINANQSIAAVFNDVKRIGIPELFKNKTRDPHSL